jgi:4-amino-4-deoxy-L-arabinose transferase
VAGEGDRSRLGGAVVLALLAFAFLGSRGLLEPDEGRYANVAARMLRSGDWVVPALNDETPHFTKPPLTYWAIAASTRLLGRHEWAARLPNGLAWLATVVLVAAIAERLRAGSGATAGLVQATTLLPHLGASMLTTDTLLAAFEALAALGLVGLWRRPSHGARLAAGVGLGLAFLTKGPVGLLPLLPMAVTLVALGEARAMGRWLHPLVLVPLLAIGGSWFAWIGLSRPEVFAYFLREEIYGRVVEGRFDRHAEWYGALRIYAPAFVLGSLPWSPLLVRRTQGLPEPLRPAWWRSLGRRDPGLLFVVLWLALPLLVLAFVRSRLPLYLLPSFAPLAILLARRVEPGRLASDPSRALLASWVLALIGIRALAAWLPLEADARPLARQIAEQIDPPPQRIVFVDDTPLWGLGYYLDAEIAGAVLRDTGRDPFPPVDVALREPGPGRIFVVRRHARKEFGARTRALGVGYRRLGAWDHVLFLEAGPDTPR